MFTNIRDDVTAVLTRDPAARNKLEVLLTYPGIHARIFHRIAHRAWQANLKGLARYISVFARFVTGIEIHPAARIGRRFFIDHGMGVVIGETVEIGDDVTLYQGVTLGGTSLNKGKRHPTLEDGVIVGAGAKVLGPFTVGAHAKIGSNAVVTKAVPANATAVGNPARIILADTQRADSVTEQAYAQKIGFMAYGAAPDLPDPVADALRILLNHMQETDKRIDVMSSTLCKLNPSFCDQKNDPLQAKDITVFTDDVKPVAD